MNDIEYKNLVHIHFDGFEVNNKKILYKDIIDKEFNDIKYIFENIGLNINEGYFNAFKKFSLFMIEATKGLNLKKEIKIQFTEKDKDILYNNFNIDIYDQLFEVLKFEVNKYLTDLNL